MTSTNTMREVKRNSFNSIVLRGGTGLAALRVRTKGIFENWCLGKKDFKCRGRECLIHV